MDIFNQELIRLQNEMEENNINNIYSNNNNYNLNQSDNKIKKIELNKKNKPKRN